MRPCRTSTLIALRRYPDPTRSATARWALTRFSNIPTTIVMRRLLAALVRVGEVAIHMPVRFTCAIDAGFAARGNFFRKKVGADSERRSCAGRSARGSAPFGAMACRVLVESSASRRKEHVMSAKKDAGRAASQSEGDIDVIEILTE